MSAAITKQCLQLFDDDLNNNQGNEKSKSIPDMKQIGTNKKSVRKKMQKLKYQNQRRIQEKQAAKRKALIQATIDKDKRKRNEDFTEDSLYQIQEMSRVRKVSAKVTKSVVEQSKGNLAKNNPLPETVQDTRTVFTDRDFDKFEQEYDFFS